MRCKDCIHFRRCVVYCGTSDILPIPNIKTKGSDGKNLHDTENRLS